MSGQRGRLRAVREDDESTLPRPVRGSLVDVVDALVAAFGGQSGIPLDDLRVLMESARVLARYEWPCPTCDAAPFERCTHTRRIHDARVCGEEPHRWLSYQGVPTLT